jgi:glyoxylase-like metal-dependent hydrolase (beta-lactamase superfamily II)
MAANAQAVPKNAMRMTPKATPLTASAGIVGGAAAGGGGVGSDRMGGRYVAAGGAVIGLRSRAPRPIVYTGGMTTVPGAVRQVGDGAYAYVQHDGSWGWSNSGLVVDGPEALVVDTLFDLRLTRDLLDAYGRVLPAGAGVTTLVNTHANGDHTFGNQLLPDARIVASRRTAEEMAEVPPALLAGLMRQAPQLGVTGEFLRRIFGPFDFEGIELTLPGTTFDGELVLRVGTKEVRLVEVGPAHTRGDTIVVVPRDRVVYTADILFVGGHPVMWAGPVENWLRALDLVLALDVDTVVPGHGPVTDKRAVAELRDYLRHLDREARARYDAGMSAREAALDIPLGGFASWGEGERVAANVRTLYAWYAGGERPGALELIEEMAALDRRGRASTR